MTILPHMSGLEFINKVKEQSAFNDILHYFVSYEEREKVQDALAVTQGHLRKPFTSNEIHSLRKLPEIT